MRINKNIGSVFIAIAFVICIIIVVVLMNGKVEVSDRNLPNIAGQSIICDNHTMRYPFADYDGSNDKEIKITANFYDNNINAIYLTYTLYYDDERQVTASEASNHADMNISFGKNGLSPDAYNAHYSKMQDSMRMSLYVSGEDLTNVAAKYFMIDLGDHLNFPATLSEYEEQYERQGFVCEISNK